MTAGADVLVGDLQDLATITVDVLRRDAEIEVAVTDTGPGIPEALHVAIFERYRRGPYHVRGLGLGATFRVQVPAAP